MEVSITQFRPEIFDLLERATNGAEVWVVHSGRRFKIVPENPPGSRLSRITPLEVLNPESPRLEQSLREEMERAWQDDWSTL
jgi:antitoxin (DNA-binding transcriptional repressor) of toxin-antitoxin stability system